VLRVHTAAVTNSYFRHFLADQQAHRLCVASPSYFQNNPQFGRLPNEIISFCIRADPDDEPVFATVWISVMEPELQIQK